MTLEGNVQEGDWSVQASVCPTADGRYTCRIHVTHHLPEGVFEREFPHGRTFGSAREALLEGLREGMIWIEMKRSRAFVV